MSGAFLWGLQFEVNEDNGSSYMSSGGVTGTRAADSFSGPFPHPPIAMTLFTKFVNLGIVSSNRVFQLANAAGSFPQLRLLWSGNVLRFAHETTALNAFSTVPDAPLIGDLVEVVCQLFADGSVAIKQSINGAPETEGARTVANELAPAWSGPLLHINSAASTNTGFQQNLAVKAHRGVRSLDFMRAL